MQSTNNSPRITALDAVRGLNTMLAIKAFIEYSQTVAADLRNISSNLNEAAWGIDEAQRDVRATQAASRAGNYIDVPAVATTLIGATESAVTSAKTNLVALLKKLGADEDTIEDVEELFDDQIDAHHQMQEAVNTTLKPNFDKVRELNGGELPKKVKATPQELDDLAASLGFPPVSRENQFFGGEVTGEETLRDSEQSVTDIDTISTKDAMSQAVQDLRDAGATVKLEGDNTVSATFENRDDYEAYVAKVAAGNYGKVTKATRVERGPRG